MDIDLPGFKKDEVKVELKDGYLTVSAAKGLDKDEQDKKGRYIRQERYAGTMQPQLLCGRGRASPKTCTPSMRTVSFRSLCRRKHPRRFLLLPTSRSNEIR